jgi:amidase
MAELLASRGHDVEQRDPDYGGVGSGIAALYLGGIRDDVKRTPRPERLESRTRGFLRIGAPYRGTLARRAKTAIEKHASRVNRLFEEHDVLMTLVTRVPAVEVGHFDGRGALRTVLAMSALYPYAACWNYLGNPAAAVPAGFTDDGLPLSVQLVGRPNDEGTLLSLAAEIEAERPWADRKPPVFR